MAKTPYLPLYYNDLRGATQDWTDEEFGAYVRLLIYQWDKGSVPSEKSRLVKIADSAEKNWPVLCQKFTPGVNGFLKNSVMERIREQFLRFAEKQRGNVLKRWGEHTKPIPNEYQTDTKPVPNEYQTDTKPVPKTYPRVEDENEYSINSSLIEKDIKENIIKEKKEKEKKEKILMPFTSEFFQASWQKWKDYRKTEFKKTYKSTIVEQAALTHLENLSNKNEFEADKIINQSIANQWQGLFELKNQQTNGAISKQQQQAAARATAIEIGKREFADLVRKSNTGN